MAIAIASILAVLALGFILMVRPKDLPKAAPLSPFAHLDDRKAAIYESLRDAQFELRLGKLSDEDYQTTKQQLQKELAVVMAEIDRVRATLPNATIASKPVQPAAKKATAGKYVCPACGAQFPQALKFCGECGKPMKVRA